MYLSVWFHSMGIIKIKKKSPLCVCVFDSNQSGLVKLRKDSHRVHICLIPFIEDYLNWQKLFILCLSVSFYLIWSNLNWVKLPIVCLSLWFYLISFFSKNNGSRAKMCGTLKIGLFIRYNFSRKYFFYRSIFFNIKWKDCSKHFFYRILKYLIILKELKIFLCKKKRFRLCRDSS